MLQSKFDTHNGNKSVNNLDVKDKYIGEASNNYINCVVQIDAINSVLLMLPNSLCPRHKP